MGKFLDEALAKYGRMTEKHMAEFKTAMLPFFARYGIGENEIRTGVNDVWTMVFYFKLKGKSESEMEEAITEYLVGLGGDGEEHLLVLENEKKGLFEWYVTIPACPKEVIEAMEMDSAARAAEEAAASQARVAKFEAEWPNLLEGIKAGKYHSKIEDGFLILQGEYYDDIEAGEKEVEFREISEYNLKRTIGIKSIRLQRGYGHPGKPPKKMRWTVTKVGLVDDYMEECDPFNVPADFEPTMIAIHLGERID